MFSSSLLCSKRDQHSWTSRIHNKSSRRSRGDSIEGYFMASRNMHWIPVGASIFASNIGSLQFVGLAGSGAAGGIGVFIFELTPVFIVIALGWLFAPVYISSGVFTMPEYIQKRFGGQRIRLCLAVVALLLNVFTRLSADIYAGALFIQESTGQLTEEWLYLSIVILLAIAALFTITGGLTAVMWTDLVQTILMLIGAVIVMILSFEKVGGLRGIEEKFPMAIPQNVSAQYSNCAKPSQYYLNFFRPIWVGHGDIPWTGMIFGTPIAAVWYWCADQVIVQRALSSRNLTHAKAGCVIASLFKILPLFLLVFPGMVARILYAEELACVEPEVCQKVCGSSTGCSNSAYVKLVLNLLPTGIRGIMISVMMAALMSSVTSIFNSSSSIFTIDIWARVRSHSWKRMTLRAIEIEKIIVGKVFVIIMVAISVLWVPVIQNYGTSQLFIYAETVSSLLSPPITAVFIMAIFWKRTNEMGAFYGFIIGLALGLAKFIIEFMYPQPHCGSVMPDSRPEWIKILVDQVHFLHFSILLFVIVLLIIIGFSLVTEPIPDESLHRLTFYTRYSSEPGITINSRKKKANALSMDDYEENNKTLSSGALKNNFIMKICGFGSDVSTHSDCMTPEEMTKRSLEFLKEDPFMSKIVNYSAIFAMVLGAFVWGFYA